MSSPERCDEGFTLVELILAIAVTAIITPAVAAVLMVSMKATDQSQDRVLGSRDAQISTMYFTRDVQSASGVALAPSACTVPSGGTFVVGFDTVDAAVTYYTTGVSGEAQLLRRHCPSTGDPTTKVMASSLTLPVAVPTCAPAPCAADARSIRLALSSRGFAFELNGTRRTTT